MASIKILNVNYPDFKFSLTDGFCFRFSIEGKELFYLVSVSNPGLKSLFYDGKLIFNQRSYNLKSSHNFAINNIPYTITLTIQNSFKIDWRCCLLRDDCTIKVFEVYSKNQGGWKKKLAYGTGCLLLSVLTPEFLWFICAPFIWLIATNSLISSMRCRITY